MPELTIENPSTETPSAPSSMAMVEPFNSAGGLPPDNEPQRKSRKKIIILFLVLVLLVAVAAGAYFLMPGPKFGSQPSTTAQTTPTAVPESAQFEAALEDTDTSLGELTTSLANVDASLDDKAGDLAE